MSDTPTEDGPEDAVQDAGGAAHADPSGDSDEVLASAEPQDGADAGTTAEAFETESLDPEIEVYDFRRPARISKDRKRSLEAIYALFVKAFEGWLAGRTRAPVHISLVNLEQLTFGEFRSSLEAPCAAYSLEVGQSQGQHAVIGMSSEVAYYLLDRFLGGAGRSEGVRERALTVMERQVTRIVAAKAASQLSEVWTEYAELDLSVVGFESIPDMLRAASREDPYLIANFEVVSADMEGTMVMAIPFAGLDGFFAADTSRRSAIAKESVAQLTDRRAAEGTLRTTGLGVHVRLPTFSIPFNQVASLTPGDVLKTPHNGSTPVEILVGQQTRYLGRAGRSGSNLAAEVIDVFDEDPKKDRRLR
ncbi:MAG: flagellar motor switch protein FliM [Longimicrobiales bacterium]